MGRRNAIRNIADRQGTNLVYGGRQLGKTALLLEVKRRYHSPVSGFHVVWIDLAFEQIGRGRPPVDLWSVMTTHLPKEIVSDQVQRSETLQKQILKWLEEDRRRRLLLLLDESDDFLSQDAEDGYQVLLGLKSLMERSERRFKVVLAGLHNVQRASRDPNTPVAHLAQPLCVGPLIDNGEAREAFRLVTMPLRALGYRIDDDIVNRVLAYSNYAPNLIQDFVYRLLNHLNDPDHVRFDPEESPPYKITSEHIENAYQLKDLRGFVRDRFQITLALDPRYRLIALMIANETLQRRQSEPTQGISVFDVGWIREQSLSWWECGFNDRTIESFRVILDEMVGLGILRSSEGRFSLRSPNIVNLLGSHGTIEQDLQDAASEPAPAPYTAAVHRRSRGKWRSSPLTAEQEHRLLHPNTGVSVLFGLKIAGLTDVADAISEAASSKQGIEVFLLNDLAENVFLGDHAKGFLKKQLDIQKPDSHLIYLLNATSHWTVAHVDLAIKMIGNLRRKNRTARVIFIGDASQAWEWQKESGRLLRDKVETISLKPWAPETLHRWLRDAPLGPLDLEHIKIVAAATGLWQTPLHQFFENALAAPDRWREAIYSLKDSTPLKSVDVNELSTENWARDVLTTIANWNGPIKPDELFLLLDVDARDIERVLEWGDVVGFIRAEKEGSWRLDPYVQSLFLAI